MTKTTIADPHRVEREQTLAKIRQAVQSGMPSVILGYEKRWVQPLLQRLTPLERVAPPFFTRAIGYQGAGRLYSLHLGGGGGEAIVSDGIASVVGDWVVFLAWMKHPLIAAALQEYDLGSVERPELHRIVIDRVTGCLYIGLVSTVEKALHAQYAAIELEAFAQAAQRMWKMLQAGAMARVAPSPGGASLLKEFVASSDWADQMCGWLNENAGGVLPNKEDENLYNNCHG